MRIEREWMRDYFRASANAREEGEVWFTKEAIARLTSGANERSRRAGRIRPDSREAIQARINAARAKAASA